MVDTLRKNLPSYQARLVPSDIDLELVMDQSVYVKKSIKSLAQEGLLGAVLCSLVILLFLGQWRMTIIAILTLPLAVMAALVGLYFTGNTINVMTLAGLALAIGPLIDIAIICLENTHRHLGMGTAPREAAFSGRQRGRDAGAGGEPLHPAGADAAGVDAGHGAVPVPADGDGRGLRHDLGLHPLADLRPGLRRQPAQGARRPTSTTTTGERPRPPSATRSAARQRAGRRGPSPAGSGRSNRGSPATRRCSTGSSTTAWLAVVGAVVLLAATLVGVGSQLRREFFPEVDAGAFEMYVRAPSGTRIELTEETIAEVEEVIKEVIHGASHREAGEVEEGEPESRT